VCSFVTSAPSCASVPAEGKALPSGFLSCHHSSTSLPILEWSLMRFSSFYVSPRRDRSGCLGFRPLSPELELTTERDLRIQVQYFPPYSRVFFFLQYFCCFAVLFIDQMVLHARISAMGEPKPFFFGWGLVIRLQYRVRRFAACATWHLALISITPLRLLYSSLAVKSPVSVCRVV
jgi:hypothetical protein